MNRIQRKRTKGWRMPAGSVYVGRPSKWGNPYPVGKPVEGLVVMTPEGLRPFRPSRTESLALYRRWLAEQILEHPSFLRPLGNDDLVCWCPESVGCHADVLNEARDARRPFPWALRQLDRPVMPDVGERPVFGVHRQPEADAETAPAWAPITEAMRQAQFARELKAFAKSLRKSA